MYFVSVTFFFCFALTLLRILWQKAMSGSKMCELKSSKSVSSDRRRLPFRRYTFDTYGTFHTPLGITERFRQEATVSLLEHFLTLRWNPHINNCQHLYYPLFTTSNFSWYAAINSCDMLKEQSLHNLHSASLNDVHIVLRSGVVAIGTEGTPEVAPQSTSTSYHWRHNRTIK